MIQMVSDYGWTGTDWGPYVAYEPLFAYYHDEHSIDCWNYLKESSRIFNLEIYND